MFCTKCGLKNDDDSMFCAGCGSPLKKPQYSQVQSMEGEVTANPEQSFAADFSQAETQAESIIQESIQSVQESVKDIEEQENIGQENMEDSFDTVDSFEDAGQTVLLQNDEPRYNEPQNNGPQYNEQQYSAPQYSEPQYGGQQYGNQMQNYGSQNNEYTYQNQMQNNAQYNQPQNQMQAQNNIQPPYNGNQYMPQQNFQNGINAGYQKNKFSVKRFIFSFIVIIASIVACVGIAFKYVGVKYEIKDDFDKEISKEYAKGYDIIKETPKTDDYESDEYNDMIKTKKLFRVMVIVFEVALVVFTIIDFILLVAVRRKGAYVFTLLFSLIKLGLGGFALYLWCFDYLDKMKKYYEATDYYAGAAGVTVTALLGLGAILAVSMQIVIFICSIILLTCKNRKKMA